MKTLDELMAKQNYRLIALHFIKIYKARYNIRKSK